MRLAGPSGDPGQPLYSATDLVNFLGCAHATALDVDRLHGRLAEAEAEADPYQAILVQKGDEHEARHLARLKAESRKPRAIIEIPKDGPLDLKVEATLRAMREGADVIYQGALTSNLPIPHSLVPPNRVPGNWHGYSDFLYKVATPSNLGDWSYEVADTKLARSAKPKHVVQLCIYSDLLALAQGTLPKHAHLILGDGSTYTVKVDDYIYYVRASQERFVKFCSDPERVSEAEPCSHCGFCDWSDRCDEEWERTGHLSLVASLARPQAKKLRGAGIDTISALAELGDDTPVKKLQTATLTRLRSQARLQMHKRTTGQNKVEVLSPEPRRGFARLPKPNPGDLFFDMEGDPVYSPEGSLEYLFGFHYLDAASGEPSAESREQFTPFWARSRAEEKKAFENAVDFMTARLKQYPDAYIYHYASYETVALKRLALQYGTAPKEQVEALKLLAQMHATRENEVDDLLRRRRFVDLYRVVRESIRVSEPSYSLKNLETFFAPARTEAITGGGDSIVAFERWLVTGDDTLLKDIEDYNKFDCRSTRLCRDWLLTLRPAETPWLDVSAELAADEAEKERERRTQDAMILAMREGLKEKSPADPGELAWRELLGHLLEYHRREARSEWWQYFKRLESSTEQLIDDTDCIGGCTVDASVAPRPDKRSLIWRLNFPEQDLKFSEGDSAVRQDTGKGAGTIVAINEAEGWLELRAGATQPAFPTVVNLIPEGPRGDDAMRDAIKLYAMDVLEENEDKYPATLSILRREKPRAALAEAEADAEAVISSMRRTHLVIQGPPGTGKTYTSAHAIVALLKAGKRVGVASNSHAAINNLLAEVEDVAREQQVTFTGIKKYSEADQKVNGTVIVDTKKNEDIEGGTHQLVGGTAWLFARPAMARKLDYLFVDEAGQVCLANVVAMSLSARNLVLVGDQMQLSQPTKAAHPMNSGQSALEYLMQGEATVPPDRGIFLAKSWRMHPDVCRFVSDAFYDGRLESAEPAKQQRLILDKPHDVLVPTGIRFDPVEREDNGQCSEEEAERVAEIYEALLGQRWVNEKGQTKQLTVEDILVVSPYNLQVNLLDETLPAGARVGTVDRFQGQEAAMVLLSMSASTVAHAPRGVAFLFSRNRLNVALSRSRCLSVVVASGRLASASCTTLADMHLLSTFSRLTRGAGTAGLRGDS